MVDLPAALFLAAVVIFLVVFYTARIVTNHTSVRLPKAVTYGSVREDGGRRALLVEVVIGIIFLGAGELIVLLFLVEPNSSAPVRLVLAAELVAAGAWFLYLARRLRGDAPG